MKVKELIEKLETQNPDATVVGDTSDHCYHRGLNVYGKGFAYIDKYGQWVASKEKDTKKKVPIVQLIFY
jgi:hypothetical protein